MSGQFQRQPINVPERLRHRARSPLRVRPWRRHEKEPRSVRQSRNTRRRHSQCASSDDHPRFRSNRGRRRRSTERIVVERTFRPTISNQCRRLRIVLRRRTQPVTDPGRLRQRAESPWWRHRYVLHRISRRRGTSIFRPPDVRTPPSARPVRRSTSTCGRTPPSSRSDGLRSHRRRTEDVTMWSHRRRVTKVIATSNRRVLADAEWTLPPLLTVTISRSPRLLSSFNDTRTVLSACFTFDSY